MMIQYKWREKKKGETDSAGVEELGEIKTKQQNESER